MFMFSFTVYSFSNLIFIMKHPIKTFLLFILLFHALVLAAQEPTILFKKNTITMGTARSFLFDKKLTGYLPSIFNVTNFSYERRITDRWQVTASYGKWFLFKEFYTAVEIWYQVPAMTGWRDDVVWRQHDHSYVDLTGGYLFCNKAAFTISGHAGPSLTWGIIEYLNSVWVNPEPPQDALYRTTKKKESHFGMVATLNCSYALWKQRISIGVFGTGRHYPGLGSTQVDVGAQLGYNF